MKREEECSSCTDDERPCSCSVEGIVTIDARGQIVLPKEVRDRAGFTPGERLMVMLSEKEGDVCCITLVKKKYLDRMASAFMQPFVRDSDTENTL